MVNGAHTIGRQHLSDFHRGSKPSPCTWPQGIHSISSEGWAGWLYTSAKDAEWVRLAGWIHLQRALLWKFSLLRVGLCWIRTHDCMRRLWAPWKPTGERGARVSVCMDCGRFQEKRGQRLPRKWWICSLKMLHLFKWRSQRPRDKHKALCEIPFHNIPKQHLLKR